MRAQSSLRYLAFGFVILIIISSMTAVAAGNTVPSTRVDNKIISFNINHLSPSACSGLTLTALVTGSGVITGTTGNTLILASDGIDTITGMDSNDCILGGDGDDTIDGVLGTMSASAVQVQTHSLIVKHKSNKPHKYQQIKPSRTRTTYPEWLYSQIL